MLARIVGAVRFKEPLSFHTSLRMGGPADFFIMPQDLDDVRYALAFAEREDLPAIILGGGNNILVSDRGVPGVVVRLQGILARADFDGDEVMAGAGVSLSGLIREAAALGLGGLECLAGIPATVGGALVTRASTTEGSILDRCSAVHFLYPDGTVGEYRPLGPGAGGLAPDLPPDAIILGCRMRLVRRPVETIHKEIKQRLKQRKTSEPFALASAGFVWKSQAETPAERLIDAVGLRGKRLNGAEISAKCSNFIINRGGATPNDVLALMEMARERVEGRFGVTLRPEIRMLGFPASATFRREPLELATAP